MKKAGKKSFVLMAASFALSVLITMWPCRANAAETVVGVLAPVTLSYEDGGGSVYSFSGGLARITQSGMSGYVDRRGEIVIAPAYDYAADFSDGLAVVGLDGKFGVVDKRGDEIATLQYDSVESYSEGYALTGLDGKYGFLNKRGEVVIAFQYDYASSFTNGLAVICREGLFGAINREGEEVIPAELVYDTVRPFTDGLAMVELNGKYGFIDMTGAEIVRPEYDYAGRFCEGFAKISLKNREGFIDTSGAVVVPVRYDYVIDYSEGLARVCAGSYPNEKYGYVDASGSVAIPLIYDYAYSFSGGYALVEQNGRYSFINGTGKAMFTLDYDYARPYSDGLAVVSKDGKEGCIDKTGDLVVPLAYEHIYSFSDGLAWVMRGGFRGILQIDSGEVTAYIYDTLKYDASSATSPGDPEQVKGFKDISGKPKEMQDAITILASIGVINGITEDEFKPDGTVTRAETAALIIRMLSNTEPGEREGFEDVGADDWFCDAVYGARKLGIMNGIDESTFSPLSSIRKDQFIAITARILRSEAGCENPFNIWEILDLFTDAGEIAGWAQADVALAASENLIMRRPDGRFDGNAEITRGDAAIILFRLYMSIETADEL